MSRNGPLAVAIWVLLAGGGCTDRACESAPPSMQVTLELAADVTSVNIHTLRAEVRAAGLLKVSNLASQPLRSSRRASFVVLLGSKGAGGIVARVTVKALNAGGGVVAWGDATFSASGDACNAFSMKLIRGGLDGGPPPDGPIFAADQGKQDQGKQDQGKQDQAPACGPGNCAGCCRVDGFCATGTADNLCGKGGAACTDCSKASSVCKASACVGVTYAWKSGSCGACSKTCGGGTCTRSVWCERSDKIKVSDSYCSGAKPSASKPCNTQPCCSTKYGTVPGFQLCSQTSTSCSFEYLTTPETTCKKVCTSKGGTCLKAQDNNVAACTPAATITCDTERLDTICTCTL